MDRIVVVIIIKCTIWHPTGDHLRCNASNQRAFALVASYWWAGLGLVLSGMTWFIRIWVHLYRYESVEWIWIRRQQLDGIVYHPLIWFIQIITNDILHHLDEKNGRGWFALILTRIEFLLLLFKYSPLWLFNGVSSLVSRQNIING